MKYLPRFLLVLLGLFAGIAPIFSAELILQSAQTQLNTPDTEFPVKVALTINNSESKNYYLRGVFFQPGTANYCGFTWNGNGWFSGPYSTGDGWKNFLKINISESTWSGEIRTKIDTTDTGCRESAIYNFKVQRFTESGSAIFDNQNDLTVQITIPTATPTFTITPSATHTPFSSPTTVNSPTSNLSIRASMIPTKIKTSDTLKLKTPTPTEIQATPASPSAVLGIQSETTESSEISQKSNSRNYIIAFSLAGIGFALLSIVLVIQNIIHAKKVSDSQNN